MKDIWFKLYYYPGFCQKNSKFSCILYNEEKEK